VCVDLKKLLLSNFHLFFSIFHYIFFAQTFAAFCWYIETENTQLSIEAQYMQGGGQRKIL